MRSFKQLTATVFTTAAVFSVQAADNSVVTVSAVVLSKNNCKFDAPISIALAFGNIDPNGGSAATASGSLSFKCGGSSATASYILTHDSGLWDTGPGANRMKHATLNQYLPYTLTLSPSSGSVAKNVTQTVNVGGSISPADFQDATMGAYADTVVVTLNP